MAIKDKKIKIDTPKKLTHKLKPSIIISTGGTGGHIFPARVVAKILKENGFKTTIFADKNYLKYHQAADIFKYKIINSSQIKKNKLSLSLAFLKISLGILSCLFSKSFIRAKIVIGFGGYATFPALISATLLRKKIILHEQNAHLGLVNRIFAKHAYMIMTSYPKTDAIKAEFTYKVQFVGNPVREEIAELQKQEYKLPNFDEEAPVENMGYNLVLASQFKKNNKKNLFNILVIGGSGGSEVFSKLLPKAFFNLRNDLKNNILVIQQCRKELLRETFEDYKRFNLNILAAEFFYDMEQKIKDAHLVISRAGSSAISEFNTAKKPLILIPLANSADNHQLKNAKFIADSKGAILLEEKELSNISNITKMIEELIDNPELLTKMSDQSFQCAILKSAEDILKLIEQI